MKVSIIAFNNLYRSPYVNIYADFCRNNGIEHEIVYPNRDNVQEEVKSTLAAMPWDPTKHKIVNFLDFRKAVIRYLKQSKPDFVVVLTTMPAVLLSGYLCRHYDGRYLVDIRDYTFEKIGIYYALEKKALNHAALNVISSPGFKKFLPKAEYQLCHNVNKDYQFGEYGKFVPTKAEQIVIGYVGSITYKCQCMRLIQLVEQDHRFCFHLYGKEVGDNDLTEYINTHPNERIKAFGPYEPSEKGNIMERVDILFNAYGNGRELLDYALSNKLYDAFYMGLPLLTSPETCMSEEAGEFSYDFDINQTVSLDGLYDWYHAINGDAFRLYAIDYMRRVFKDQEEFVTRLQEIIRERGVE